MNEDQSSPAASMVVEPNVAPPDPIPPATDPISVSGPVAPAPEPVLPASSTVPDMTKPSSSSIYPDVVAGPLASPTSYGAGDPLPSAATTGTSKSFMSFGGGTRFGFIGLVLVVAALAACLLPVFWYDVLSKFHIWIVVILLFSLGGFVMGLLSFLGDKKSVMGLAAVAVGAVIGVNAFLVESYYLKVQYEQNKVEREFNDRYGSDSGSDSFYDYGL